MRLNLQERIYFSFFLLMKHFIILLLFFKADLCRTLGLTSQQLTIKAPQGAGSVFSQWLRFPLCMCLSASLPSPEVGFTAFSHARFVHNTTFAGLLFICFYSISKY